MENYTPVLLKEFIVSQLYDQKEIARRFNFFLLKLWEKIDELKEAECQLLQEKIGAERFLELLSNTKARKNITREENIALIDVVSQDLKQEIFGDSTLPEKQINFFKRKKIEARAFLDMVQTVQGDIIVDIAGGAGDIGRSLAQLHNKKALILDFNDNQILYANELNKYLHQENIEAKKFNIREEKIPNGTWVSKHPCGDLADIIIHQWVSSKSPELYLMTCCQGKAAAYDNPYGFSKEEWKTMCRESDGTNSEDDKMRTMGELAMKKMDEARKEYLEKHGFEVELKQIPGIIKGNVIIARRTKKQAV